MMSIYHFWRSLRPPVLIRPIVVVRRLLFLVWLGCEHSSSWWRVSFHSLIGRTYRRTNSSCIFLLGFSLCSPLVFRSTRQRNESYKSPISFSTGLPKWNGRCCRSILFYALPELSGAFAVRFRWHRGLNKCKGRRPCLIGAPVCK